MTTPNKPRFAVFGHPVAHSKSPQIHQHFAEQYQRQIDYQRILLPVDGLDGFAQGVADFCAAGGVGANVTVPFKELAFQLCQSEPHQLSIRAQLAGAVNTLVMQGQRYLGDNTDGAGLINDITVNWALPIANKRILLLGAGGAARGILPPLLQQNPATVLIANRRQQRAIQLIADLQTAQFPQNLLSSCQTIALAELATITQPFDLIINATSASLHQETITIPDTLLHAETAAYDMMYDLSQLTLFLMQMQNMNVRHLRDGWGMLVEQAAESFALWHNIRPSTSQLILNRAV